MLSNLRFRHSRSLFIFPVTRTKKEKLRQNPLQLIFMSSRSRNHGVKRKSHSHSSNSFKKRRKHSKKLRKSKGSSSTNEIITQKLFRVTQEHHRNCLRKLFLKYYEPSVINGTLEINKQWTRDVGKNVLDHLRLHLTWVLKGEVFHWTDEQIGKKTLSMFSDFGKISSNMFVSCTR